MHPSRAIRGGKSQLLAGRRVIVGVTGSIAAIEVPRVVRELVRHGADVRIVLSPEATRILTPEAATFASGHPPVLQLTGDVEHVTYLGPGEGRADLLLIAPATANTISKIAHGIDDTPVTSFASIALGGGVPVLVAPAMHADMGANPAIRENLERLRSWGIGIIPAIAGEGEEKLAGPEEVAAAVLHRLGGRPWAGRRVLVIGGASREPIDAVRSLTNESSGETAVQLAAQAYFRGAEVTGWLGAVEVPIPSYLSVHRWGSVSDLLALVRREAGAIGKMDVVLVPAALSDYTTQPHAGKISSSETPDLRLHFTPAPRVLPRLRRLVPKTARLVGFKLQAGLAPSELESAARSFLEVNDLDEVVANDRVAMGNRESNVVVVMRGGQRHWIAGPKAEVAGKLLDDLGRNLGEPAKGPSGGRSKPRSRRARRPSVRAELRTPPGQSPRRAPRTS